MASFFGSDLTKSQKKIVLLSSLGGMLEFYDFTIYGLFAVYFAHQFFPSSNEYLSLIATYSVFVIGYVVRPIGGVFFSHIGDERGRKKVLTMTMMLMGVSAIGIGILPTYAQIGIFAPILMLVLRTLQGLAIGGELPSMIVYATESMPNERKYAMGAIFAGTLGGTLPAMLLNIWITHYLTPEQITSIGWRIPFLIGGLLCFVAYKVRKTLHETKEFTNIGKTHVRYPFIELIRHHFEKVILGVGLVAIMGTPIILLVIFLPSYLIKIVKIVPTIASEVVLFSAIIGIISTYTMGVIAKRYNLYKLIRNCLWLILICGGLCYYLMANQYNLMLAVFLFAVFQGSLVALIPVILSDIFPTNIRLSGVALSYNISFVIFGGLTPIIITILIQKTGAIFLVPFICLAVTVFVSMCALIYSRKYMNPTD